MMKFENEQHLDELDRQFIQDTIDALTAEQPTAAQAALAEQVRDGSNVIDMKRWWSQKEADMDKTEYIETMTRHWLNAERETWLIDQPIAETPEQHEALEDAWKRERERILSTEGKEQEAIFNEDWERLLSAVRFRVERGEFAGWTAAAILAKEERSNIPRFEPDGSIACAGVPLWLCRIDGELEAVEEYEGFAALADGQKVEPLGPIVFWQRPMVEAAAA